MFAILLRAPLLPVQIPSEVAGVLSVAATGLNGLKSYYSNFGKLFVGVRALQLFATE